MTKPYKPATLAAQALGDIDETTQALIPPIYTSTTYLRAPDNQYPTGNVYSRADNPTYDPAERLLCALEKGADAMLFSSGMAAAVAVFQALATGDHLIAPKVMYWSLRNWLQNWSQQWQVAVDFVDMTDLAAVKAALRPGKTRLIWAESPANPLWSVVDIAALAELAHGVGARLAVDSTVATPVLTQPVTLGADIVMHSATKYLNGHSDVIAGALVTASQDDFWEKLVKNRSQGGAVMGPVEAAMLLRGMRTLTLRVQQACRSALWLAQQLEQHPRVEAVLYPGLPGFAGHELAARQMQGGFGGMLSIRVKDGEAGAIAVAARVSLWKRATSLGGVESLIEHRASIEGAGTPVPADLLRLSVGIEDAEDLWQDLCKALDESA